MVGAVTDSHWFNQEEMDKLRHHVLLVIMPVFFLSTGLRTNWDVGGTMVFIAAVAPKLEKLREVIFRSR